MEREIEAATSVRATLDRAQRVLRADPIAVVATRPASIQERKGRAFRTSITASLGDDFAVNHDVDVTVGRPTSEAGSAALAVPLSWVPASHASVLPSFDGELHALDGADGTALVLRGTYSVPLGFVGRFGDSVLGRRIARQSVTELLERIARSVDRHVDERSRDVALRPAPYNVDLRERAETDDRAR